MVAIMLLNIMVKYIVMFIRWDSSEVCGKQIFGEMVSLKEQSPRHKKVIQRKESESFIL